MQDHKIYLPTPYNEADDLKKASMQDLLLLPSSRLAFVTLPEPATPLV
jgi:hypothetical protein